MKARAQKPLTCGFRFSLTDAIAIGVFLSAAGVLCYLRSPLWWLLLIAAGHFFLFCNIIRMWRPRELIWAALFVANVAAWTWFDRLNWLGVLACQLPITLTLVMLEMRSRYYHGVFAKRFNPRLAEYLEGRL